MKRPMMTVLAVAALLAGGRAVALEETREGVVTDLGYGYPTGISNATSPHVVGWDGPLDVSNGLFSFLWRDGARTPIDRGSEFGTIASGVNEAGRVAGTAYAFDGAPGTDTFIAFRWDAAGGFHDLSSGAAAHAINGSDAVVGKANGRATLWEDGDGTDLGVLSGDVSSVANGINDAGQVVGSSWGEDGTGSRAFLWDAEGGMVDLGLGDGSWANAINDAGQVVAGTADGPVLWEDGLAARLGDLDGDTDGISSGAAHAINDQGQVVGWSPTGEFVRHYVTRYYYYYGYYDTPVVHATLWEDGVPIDLNDFLPAGSGWDLQAATGINDAGQIVGWGFLYGDNRAFALSLVTGAPAAPTGLAATAAPGRISLAWNASLEASSYDLKRSTAAGGPYSAIASGLTGTGFTDTGVSDGTTYHYVVAARNVFGASPDSASVAVTAPAPPAAPTNLVAANKKVKNERRVTLGWTQSSGANLASNRIHRSTTKGGPYTMVAQVGPTTQYVDLFNATDKTVYYYRVSAVNVYGQEGALSNEAAAAAK